MDDAQVDEEMGVEVPYIGHIHTRDTTYYKTINLY